MSILHVHKYKLQQHVHVYNSLVAYLNVMLYMHDDTITCTCMLSTRGIVYSYLDY